MIANLAPPRGRWPIVLAVAANLIGCVTESICVPGPPAPASCASFEAGSGGRGHLVLTAACGYTDEDVTITLERTGASSTVHVPASGIATSPDFDLITGDVFTLRPDDRRDCGGLLACAIYTAPGPATDCQ